MIGISYILNAGSKEESRVSLSYCPRCGKLFARGIREVCNACTENIEKEYETCVEYLRQHKGATIHEVSEETGISVKQITKFIREGRISTQNLPNLTVPCEICGLPIQEGVMCQSCRDKLQRDLRNSSQRGVQSPSREQQGGSSKGNAFQIRDHH